MKSEMKSETEVVIVGGGAAGIAAARRLHDARVDCLLVEARPRLGGRAFTVQDESGFALDLGCGWLHSADRNPWTDIAIAQGRVIDKTPPPWSRLALPVGFPLNEQKEFRDALDAFRQRLDAAAEREPDVAAASVLEPQGRWNDLIIATGTYTTGGQLARVSAHDYGRYEDDGVNWRVAEGYGTAIAAHAAGVPMALDTPVRRMDRSRRRLGIE